MTDTEYYAAIEKGFKQDIMTLTKCKDFETIEDAFFWYGGFLERNPGAIG